MSLFKRCKGHDETKCRHPFWYVFELTGTRYSRSTRTANRQLAARIEDRRRIAILDGKDEAPKKPLMLSAHIADYVAHTKEHNATAYKDAAVLARFQKVVGDRPLKDVSAFGAAKWMKERAGAVAKSTVNRELNIVRGCFARAVEWSRIGLSPMRTVKPFVVDDARIRILSDDELRTVFGSAPADVVLICRTTLECLPRLSEVLGIRREHIGPGWIEFRRKGGKVTRAAVPDDLRAALLAKALVSSSGLVFGEGADGRAPTEQTASNRIVRALRALGIKGASHHTMRHTGVTLMLERGVNPRVIQTLAGWGSLTMLQRYGHVRDAEIQRAVHGNAAHLAALGR